MVAIGSDPAPVDRRTTADGNRVRVTDRAKRMLPLAAGVAAEHVVLADSALEQRHRATDGFTMQPPAALDAEPGGQAPR